MSSRGVRAFVVGAFAVGAVLVAWRCSVYDNTLLVFADSGDAAVDGLSPPDVNSCSSYGWPRRPAVSTDDGGSDIEFYAAVKTLDFGVGDGGASTKIIGYNLDGVCTCPGSDSCMPFGEAGSQCDLAGGVDNSAGTLIKQFNGGYAFFSEDFLNQGIAAGIYGALFRVRNYNGLAEDSQVELDVFTSNGTAGVGTDAGPTPAKFDGTDVWTLDPGSLQGGALDDAAPKPRIAYDLNAYVSNYTLVANISDMPLAIGAANGAGLVTIELSSAYVILALTPFGHGGTQFSAVGTVTGRWESSKLLTSLAVLRSPDQDGGLCGPDVLYQLLKARVCSKQDIAANALDDSTGAPCGALSLAFNFTAVPAHYGTVFASQNSGIGGCGPTWSDQCGP